MGFGGWALAEQRVRYADQTASAAWHM